MRSLWIVLLFLCLLFAAQASGAPVLAVGPGGDETLPSLVAATNGAVAPPGSAPSAPTNTATGVLGLGNTGSSTNTPFTTTIPGSGGSVAGVPTSNQIITPVNPVGATTTLNGGTASTTLNAPGTTTGVTGSTGLPTAGTGSVSTAVAPFNTTSVATATNQGFTALSPGAGSGLNNGIPAAAGGGSLTTAPAPNTSTTSNTIANNLAPTQAGVTGAANAGSAGTAGTVSNAGGITPAPNLGQP